jgi:hypothetical protein
MQICEYCRPSYERISYVRISEIRDEICWFRNFGRQWEYVKSVRDTDTGLTL